MSEQMTVEPLPEEIQAADKVGRYVGRSWPNVDTDDLVAELYLWLCRNGRHLERWREEGVHGANKLRVSLARHARKYARREHDIVTGGVVEEGAAYEEAELEVLLTFVFTDDEWATAGSDLLASLADVSSALHGMAAADVQLLRDRYGRDRTLNDIGAELGCTEDAARMRVKRTLDRLCQRLAGEGAVWSGRRTVVSNAAAQAATRGQDR